MSLAITRATKGLKSDSVQRKFPFGALSITTNMLNYGRATSPTAGSGFPSIENFTDTIGIIAAESILPVAGSSISSGVKITVTPTMPSDYRRHFVVIRGRVEYKRSFDDTPYEIIYTNSDSPLSSDDIVIVDNNIELGEHYYYGILALIGSTTENAHYEYNSNTGFTTAYAYKDYSLGATMLSLLPEEWQTKQTGSSNDFTSRFLNIFAILFDSIRTDIESYILKSNSIWDIQEQQLPLLASMVGWEVNKELKESVQRQEVDAASDFYRIKGRDQGIKFFIQLVSGWEVEFEQGWRRVLEAGELGIAPDSTDAYAISHKSHPWRPIYDEVLGSSTGLASQTFSVLNSHAERVIVQVSNDAGVSWVTWREVPYADLNTGADATALTFSFTKTALGVGTVTFSDGVNGAIPSAGVNNIRTSYHYGGDIIKYAAEYPKDKGWRNIVGVRVLLKNTAASLPITDVIINKFNKILEEKASYVVYAPIVIPDEGLILERPVIANDSYTDTQTIGNIIQSNTLGDTSNTENYMSALYPA